MRLMLRITFARFGFLLSLSSQRSFFFFFEGFISCSPHALGVWRRESVRFVSTAENSSTLRVRWAEGAAGSYRHRKTKSPCSENRGSRLRVSVLLSRQRARICQSGIRSAGIVAWESRNSRLHQFANFFQARGFERRQAAVGFVPAEAGCIQHRQHVGHGAIHLYV